MTREEQLKKLKKLKEKYSGAKYHLCIEDNGEEIEWALFREYIDPNVYFSSDNKAIMTSKDHSIQWLEKYLKEHYEGNVSLGYLTLSFATIWITFSIYTIFVLTGNVNDFIRGIYYGILIENFIGATIIHFYSGKKHNVIMKELKEATVNSIDKYKEELESLMEDIDDGE